MTPSPANQTRVESAMIRLEAASKAAQEAKDFDACRRALNDVWFAVHHAQDVLNTVERETREAALSAVEGKAA